MTKTVRTPDACFDDLPDCDFAAHYVDIEGPELAQVAVDFVGRTKSEKSLARPG